MADAQLFVDIIEHYRLIQNMDLFQELTSMSSNNREMIKTTCPRDCYDACGIVAVKDNGKLRKIMGDPTHKPTGGALCGKCAIAYNGVFTDHNSRLLTPLKRAGSKGEAQFVAISWTEAISLIKDKIKPLLENSEHSHIYHTHYTGTVSLIAGWYPIRFFNRIGATEVDPDSVCNKAGHEALTYMFGASEEGFDPRTLKDAKCIIVWGANPSHTAPHQNKRWLMQADIPIISIDPIAHATAKASDVHLQLKPGSDAALAFCFMNIARREGLIDDQYLAENSIGFEELEESINAATSERTALLTGLSVDDIEMVGKIYAKGPSMIWLGQGLQRQPRGGNVFRAIATLCVATGNISKPGTGFCYMNGRDIRGIDVNTIVPDDLKTIGPSPDSISHMDLADALLDKGRTKVFFAWNNNIMASSPEQKKLRQGLAREDLFTVCVELFHTDTTNYADLVLPAASFLEFDDLVVPYFDLTVSAQTKVIEPMGECLPNQEIFRKIASALDLQDEALFESDESILAKCLAATGYEGNFEDLKRLGTVELFEETRLQFHDKKFDTPSGKIEIACDAIIQKGMPRLPEPHVDQSTAKGKLRVISPASNWLMNSTYGNDARILKKLGAPSILIHAHDATRMALEEGEMVNVNNATGELQLMIKISDIAQPGVAVIYKGHWPGKDGTKANVNVLNPGLKTDLAESSSVHAIEVTITKLKAV